MFALLDVLKDGESRTLAFADLKSAKAFLELVELYKRKEKLVSAMVMVHTGLSMM